MDLTTDLPKSSSNLDLDFGKSPSLVFHLSSDVSTRYRRSPSMSFLLYPKMFSFSFCTKPLPWLLIPDVTIHPTFSLLSKVNSPEHLFGEEVPYRSKENSISSFSHRSPFTLQGLPCHLPKVSVVSPSLKPVQSPKCLFKPLLSNSLVPTDFIYFWHPD